MTTTAPDRRSAYGLVTDFDPFRRIEADTLALAEVADGHLTRPVPSCPGWTVADLVWHLTEVHHFWGAIVAGRVQDPAEVANAARPADDAELVPALRAGVERLVATLRAAAPREPVWTWAAQRDVAFVVRHQAQEAAVHRWDAERAVGLDVPLDATAATDGVEEFLQVTTPFRNDDAEPMDGRLTLVAADTGLRWAVEEDAEGTARWHRLAGDAETDTETDTDTETGGSGTVLRAPASDLLLYLFGRRPAAALDVTGEVGVAERFARRNPTD
jgi:uncharacterized protein (TIGR03083 family)